MAKKELNIGNLLSNVANRVNQADTEVADITNEVPKPTNEQSVAKIDAPTSISTETATPRKGPKSGTVGRGHVINANLDDELYWRADTIKKRLNKDRVGDAPFVSINTLLCNALEIWADQNYPETKDQYRQLKEMGVI